MPGPEELLLTTPGLRVAGRAWGPPDGVPVLALHGWLDNAASFDALAPHLPAARLVALDLPGHGLSQWHPPQMLYPFVEMVAAVRRAVRALGWDRFALIGHSLGAAVSSVFAGTFPEFVSRLVLLEGLGPLAEAPEHAGERLAKSIHDEDQRVARGDGQRPAYPSREAAIKRLQTQVAGLGSTAATVLCARGLVAVPGGYAWRADPRLRIASRVRLTHEQVCAYLRGIACPTLLVRATDGFPFAAQAMQQRAEQIADLRLVEVPGAHHVHLDDAKTVADVVVPFLAPLWTDGDGGR